MPAAVDSSSPPKLGASVAAQTTASFNPPANALLVACMWADPGRTFTMSNNGTATTWTQVIHSFPTSKASVSVFRASPGAARTGMTVTATGSITNDFGFKVYVITGADLTTPVGFTTTGQATTNPLSVNITPASSNSLGFVICADLTTGPAVGTSSSNSTFDNYDLAGNVSGGSGYRLMGAAGGTENFLVNQNTASNPTDWTYGLFEIEAAAAAAVRVQAVYDRPARRRLLR